MVLGRYMVDAGVEGRILIELARSHGISQSVGGS